MLVLVFGLVSCALLWPLNRHLPLLRHPHRWLMGQACGYVFYVFDRAQALWTQNC